MGSVYRSSKPRGVPPQTEKRVLYIQLMKQGIGNAQACRIVGVNRRTGKRWRYGRTVRTFDGRQLHYAPITPAAEEISERFLSGDERVKIADLLRERKSLRAIAEALGRNPSTISREVRRNRDPETSAYRPHEAHQRARGRRTRPKPTKLASNPELHRFVQERLQQHWSPEQIAQALPKLFPDRTDMRVTHETIYQALYLQGRGELRRELTRALRTGRARRRRRSNAGARTSRFDGMVMISERPAEVADRAVPGHWEGDLIMGAQNRSAIGTLVERTTRYVMLLHLPNGHSAGHVRDALAAAVSALPEHLTRSITWDQGSEMARHTEFSVATDIPIYFCDPASPWQRGTNENTNGLLRQYFPKGADLTTYRKTQLDTAALELNTRPRKTLDWDTPAQRLLNLLTSTH